MSPNKVNGYEGAEKPADDLQMKHYSEIIGKNIRIERRKRKFSIDDLADCIELSSSYIGLLERGDRCPSLSSLIRLCALFKVTPNDLLLKRGVKGLAAVAEKKENDQNDYYKAVVSLLHTLNKSQLKFIANVIKSLKKISFEHSDEGGGERDGEDGHEIVTYSK